MAESGIKSAGTILAGGLSRRMEGPEKSLLPLGGKPLIEHVSNRLSPQVETLIINANGDPARFGFLNLPVQEDVIEGFAGPLAGVLSAMHWARENSPCAERVVTAAADTPFFPEDLVARFDDILGNTDEGVRSNMICLAYSDGNRHPVFGSWPIGLHDALKAFLVDEGERKVMLFAQRYQLEKIEFPLKELQGQMFDPFFNINTPDDFAMAEAHLEQFAA